MALQAIPKGPPSTPRAMRQTKLSRGNRVLKIAAKSELTVSQPLSVGFHHLPGELRNTIYHLLFEQILPIIPPPNDHLTEIHGHIVYTSARRIQRLCGVFLASRLISSEARAIFYAHYSQRRHYTLLTRASIYAFTRLPSQWVQNLHCISLSARGVPAGRKIFNPVKVALIQAARADTHKDPSTRFEARKLTLKVHDSTHLRRKVKASFVANFEVGGEDTNLCVLLLPYNNFEVTLTGPIGKLDWTMIPMMKYTEDAAWEQFKGRRARLLQSCTLEAPLHQIPTDLLASLPYTEECNAAKDLVREFAEELARAGGFAVPGPEGWELPNKSEREWPL